MVSNDQFQIPPQYLAPKVTNEYVNQEIIRMEEQHRIDQNFENIVAQEQQAERNEINRRFDSIIQREFPIEPEIDPRYHHAKEIESKILQFRNMADQTTIPRYGLARLMNYAKETFIPPDSETLERQLVDVEARIGGEVIEEIIRNDMLERTGRVGHITPRLFFFQKGYWYLQEGLEETAPVVSYQLEANQYYKSFNGKPVAFQPGEAEALLQYIPMYFQAIQKDLYRRD